MRGAPPPVAHGEEQDGDRPRCPRCGCGELFSIDLTRTAGAARRGTYCAGLYDRDRRRFVRRSCGYTRLPPEDPGQAQPGVA